MLLKRADFFVTLFLLVQINVFYIHASLRDWHRDGIFEKVWHLLSIFDILFGPSIFVISVQKVIGEVHALGLFRGYFYHFGHLTDVEMLFVLVMMKGRLVNCWVGLECLGWYAVSCGFVVRRA